MAESYQLADNLVFIYIVFQGEQGPSGPDGNDGPQGERVCSMQLYITSMHEDIWKLHVQLFTCDLCDLNQP